MTEIVIASAARTPVGSFNGAFAALPGHALGTIAIAGACTLAGKAPPKPGPPAIARHHPLPR